MKPTVIISESGITVHDDRIWVRADLKEKKFKYVYGDQGANECGFSSLQNSRGEFFNEEPGIAMIMGLFYLLKKHGR